MSLIAKLQGRIFSYRDWPIHLKHPILQYQSQAWIFFKKWGLALPKAINLLCKDSPLAQPRKYSFCPGSHYLGDSFFQYGKALPQRRQIYFYQSIWASLKLALWVHKLNIKTITILLLVFYNKRNCALRPAWLHFKL